MMTRQVKQAPRPRSFLEVQSLEDRLTPATFIVSGDDDNFGINPQPGEGKDTLRQAIIDANASSGVDTIEFDSTFFNTPRTIFLLAALPALSDDIVIVGTDKTNCIINGDSQYAIFQTSGTGINLEISNVTLEAGSAASGGGIGVADGTLMLSGSEIRDCTAIGDGGGIAVGGNLGISFVTIADCTASNGSGGGVYAANGNIYIEYPTFTGCTAPDDDFDPVAGPQAFGGGIAVVNSDLYMMAGAISGCTAFNDGGGVHADSSTVYLSISDCLAANGSGGGVAMLDSQLQGYYLNVDNCSAFDSGGGIEFDGDATNVAQFKNLLSPITPSSTAMAVVASASRPAS